MQKAKMWGVTVVAFIQLTCTHNAVGNITATKCFLLT